MMMIVISCTIIVVISSTGTADAARIRRYQETRRPPQPPSLPPQRLQTLAPTHQYSFTDDTANMDDDEYNPSSFCHIMGSLMDPFGLLGGGWSCVDDVEFTYSGSLKKQCIDKPASPGAISTTRRGGESNDDPSISMQPTICFASLKTAIIRLDPDDYPVAEQSTWIIFHKKNHSSWGSAEERIRLLVYGDPRNVSDWSKRSCDFTWNNQKCRSCSLTCDSLGSEQLAYSVDCSNLADGVVALNCVVPDEYDWPYILPMEIIRAFGEAQGPGTFSALTNAVSINLNAESRALTPGDNSNGVVSDEGQCEVFMAFCDQLFVESDVGWCECEYTGDVDGDAVEYEAFFYDYGLCVDLSINYWAIGHTNENNDNLNWDRAQSICFVWQLWMHGIFYPTESKIPIQIESRRIIYDQSDRAPYVNSLDTGINTESIEILLYGDILETTDWSKRSCNFTWNNNLCKSCSMSCGSDGNLAYSMDCTNLGDDMIFDCIVPTSAFDYDVIPLMIIRTFGEAKMSISESNRDILANSPSRGGSSHGGTRVFLLRVIAASLVVFWLVTDNFNW